MPPAFQDHQRLVRRPSHGPHRHADQEELANPVIGTVGDLIKSFKYQSMPGIDQIGAYGRASAAYKVVSSAANNYDRPQW